MSTGQKPREIAMRRTYLVVSAALIAVATPVLAAEYYVAKVTETGKCKVVSEKPDGTKLVMVGTQAYATEDEAKTAKKASAECGKGKKKDASAAPYAPAASDRSANKDAPANADAPPA
jgi:hypothetical protein